MNNIKPIKIVKPTVVPVSSNNSDHIDSAEARSGWDPRLIPDESLAEDLKHYPLMKFFDLSNDERADDTINDKVKSVYKWVINTTKSDEQDKIVKTLRYLEMDIGVPDLGTSRLDHIYNFVTIENNIEDLRNERRFRYGF